MKRINLTARTISIIGSSYNAIALEIELNEQEIDTVEIAESISFDTFFNAFDEGEIKRYVEKNYDWFDKEGDL